MKDIPGVVNIRSNTGRGSSVVNVFFNWRVDMEQSELHVHSRLSQVRSQPARHRRRPRLPPDVFGVSDHRHQPDQHRPVAPGALTVAADDDHQAALSPHPRRGPRRPRGRPRARVPRHRRSAAASRRNSSSLPQVTDALVKNNLVAAGGLHEEKDTALPHARRRPRHIDPARSRTSSSPDRRAARCASATSPRSVPAAEPADHHRHRRRRRRPCCINVRSQPDGSTLDIADELKREMRELQRRSCRRT